MAIRSIHVRGHNLLLASLPQDEYERLLPQLESITIEADQVLFEPFKPIRDVVFPISGAISLMMLAGPGQQIEAGLVGNEGVVGVCVALGSDRAPMRAVTQTSVHGLRMSARAFRAEMARNGPLAEAIRRYAQGYLVMLSQGLACMRAHRVEQRCARWLLMLHDRVDGDHFRLTHKALAQMLGVRRATVTEVASRLQSRGLVHYERGLMTIANRAGLEKTACECYQVVQRELARLLGTRVPRRAAR